MIDNIKGELRIFTREVETSKGNKRILFNACVGSTKNEDGSFLNYYMPINFSNAVKKEIANTNVYTNKHFDCLVEDAWIKAYKDSDENTRPILFVNKAKIVFEDKKETKETKKSKTKQTKRSEETKEDLPF